MKKALETPAELKEELIFQGIGVAPGVVIGPAFLWNSTEENVVERLLTPDEVPQEIKRFERAVIETRGQLKEIQADLTHGGMADEDASIFDAHLLFLDDHHLIDEAVNQVIEHQVNAESALRRVANQYIAVLSAVEDDYLRERGVDVKDVVRRVFRNLKGGVHSIADAVQSSCVIIARDLAPSDTAGINRELVSGFATDLGSPTSHTAVMARALEIPAVVGLHDVASREDLAGCTVLIDGTRGVLIVNPSPESLEQYGSFEKERQTLRSGLDQIKEEESVTLDGKKITLSANVESAEDIAAVKEYGAHGVGLFRSEYLYLNHEHSMPSEEEQTATYTQAARELDPDPLIIRTLDLGGDKFTSHVKLPKEMNPFLGCRAIRFCLAMPDLFLTQLRAILRASAYGNVKIMYPMVTKASEVQEANDLLAKAKEQLKEQGVAFNEDIEVGAMIETPSAAMTADLIARHVDFFSLGTNDLIQYTLAVDRVNELVAYLYEPTHPSILRLIRQTIEIGHRHNAWVGVCGEMAADPLLAPILIGLGIDELSVTPSAVPLVKEVIRNINMDQAQDLAGTALASSSPEQILRICKELVGKVAPNILELVT